MSNESSSGNQPKQNLKSRIRQFFMFILLVLLLAGIGGYFWLTRDTNEVAKQDSKTSNQPLDGTNLTAEVIADGYDHIWDSVFVDSNTLIFNERNGNIHGLSLSSQERWQLATVPGVRASGEGGLLGMALDNEFAVNRFGYVCYNADSTPLSVRVARFTISEDSKSTSGFTEIVSDIASQAGRHSGCRLVMDKQNILWVGTGDSALATAPQDLNSLAGKVLRVDRDGKPASGNVPEPFDPRIYSYGHRNIQGITLFDEPASNGAIGLTSEHGPDRADEVNWLLPGNFGWDPFTSRAGYDESVPMTDKSKFPEAITAIWSSGESTIAVSDLGILKHERWQDWQGRIVMAVLKDKHIRVLNFLPDGSVGGEEKILTNYGRIRSITEAANGALYISTDNGSDDKIIKVIPN